MMKIVVIEDKIVSVNSAKRQFKDHDLKVLTNAFEVINELLTLDKNEFPDLILTDLEIPNGEPKQEHLHMLAPKDVRPEKISQIGFLVKDFACKHKIPCLIITDNSSHRSVMGIAIDQGGLQPAKEYSCGIITRPSWIENNQNKGKNWISDLKWASRTYFKPADYNRIKILLSTS